MLATLERWNSQRLDLFVYWSQRVVTYADAADLCRYYGLKASHGPICGRDGVVLRYQFSVRAWFPAWFFWVAPLCYWSWKQAAADLERRMNRQAAWG